MLVILVDWVVWKERINRVFNHEGKNRIENIMERYENSLAAKKGAHGRRILEKSKSKDFQIPKETTDKGLNNGVMRFIDETDISTLNMDQLSQIERLLEDELRWTRARKLEANIIARSQKKVHGKAAIDESSSTEIPSRKEKKQVDGSQQSGEEVEVVVVSQSPTPATGGGGAPEQRHWTPVDLNIPCRDAGPLQ
ncbi:hypothetical protein E2562_015049 [Oryza meyeriana var. granulata]|uniref:Uncharacterized protein n=1 Tax=Oryza meyeriana var. granulata TaxID=110450 RepID=A0A6G1EK54_9ORYZ|nr:hypothetical protein E2562_015049 [Oryza meyeriana var. granulata]